MTSLRWLVPCAAALCSGCAVYPVDPVPPAAPPGIVYGAPAPVVVAPPYGYYDYGYPYAPAFYGPPLFIHGSIGFVHRSGPRHHPFGGPRSFGGPHHGGVPARRPGGR